MDSAKRVQDTRMKKGEANLLGPGYPEQKVPWDGKSLPWSRGNTIFVVEIKEGDEKNRLVPT